MRRWLTTTLPVVRVLLVLCVVGCCVVSVWEHWLVFAMFVLCGMIAVPVCLAMDAVRAWLRRPPAPRGFDVIVRPDGGAAAAPAAPEPQRSTVAPCPACGSALSHAGAPCPQCGHAARAP
jgi:hypothetical protein